MAITQLPFALLVQLTVWTIVATALALLLAPQIAELLIRFRANRLPDHLAQRYSEEWIAEVKAIANRFRKLTFAIAISVMRSKTLVDAEDGISIPGLNSTAPVVLSVADVRVFSDFWHRLGALLIDTVLLAGVSFIVYAALRPFMPTVAMRLLFMTAWLLVVQVYCVRRFGGSPGKLLLKMRIVTMSGEPLTSRHALVRALPDYVLSTVSVLITAWALSQVDSSGFDALPITKRAELLRAATAAIPLWIRWPLTTCQYVWVIGELGVFIDSYEKRALHDLIAGTVVVYKIPRVVGSLSDNPPVGSTSAYR
jgi:uncharacterized RDD family membrane protein YckC